MVDPAGLALETTFQVGRARRCQAHVDLGERRQAFVRLVQTHAGRAHALARRLLGDDRADDAVQEAFLRAWRGLARFRDEARIETWLYRIVLNVCRDRWRARPAPASLGAEPERAGPAFDPERRLLSRDLAARVWRATASLTPRQRECLVLRAQVGLGHGAIAELLGVAPAVVKLHLVNARRALLERFAKEVEEWGIEKR